MCTSVTNKSEVRFSHLPSDVRDRASDRNDALPGFDSSDQHIGTRKQPIALDDADAVVPNVEKTKIQPVVSEDAGTVTPGVGKTRKKTPKSGNALQDVSIADLG